MITVYGICYNEQIMLPFFIAHYRMMFPGCEIIIYDNESTDASPDIAKQMGCKVIPFSTNNTLSDRTYLEIKNKVWKSAATDWVLLADIDEHLYINESSLREEEKNHVTVITAEGFNMCSDDDNEFYSPFDIKKGVRAPSYDKLYLFNKRYVKEINYLYGCHKAQPMGAVKFSSTHYVCKHYKYYNLPFMIGRHAEFGRRMSDHNKKLGLGGHYLYTPEEIKKEFNEARRKAITI